MLNTRRRVTTELDQGRAELKLMIPTAYTNVFAVPCNELWQSPPELLGRRTPT